MKTILLASAISAAIAVPAIAADMPVKAPPLVVETVYNWGGFYVGINGGPNFGRSRHDVVGGGTTGSFRVNGAMIGGTAGFNIQRGSFVFGIEGDYDWTDIRGTADCPAAFFTCGTRSTWLATARGRIGHTWGPTLFYVTGGGAFGDIRQSAVGIVSFAGTQTRSGWTVGVGSEYQFTNNLSFKAEYLFVDLGSFNCGTVCTGPGGGTINVRLREDLFRVGVNYKFGGPVIARY